MNLDISHVDLDGAGHGDAVLTTVNGERARTLCERFGFEAYELDPATGRALVMQKKH